MTLLKTLRKVFGTLLIPAFLFCATPKTKADNIIFNDFRINCLSDSTAELQTIPEYMRDVPAHIDDGGYETEPIKDKDVSLWLGASIEDKFGGGIQNYIGDSGPLIGFVGGINFGLGYMNGGMNERNYTNHPGTSERGYGAALTYYKINRFNFDIGLFAKLSLSEYLQEDSFFLEYSANLSLNNIQIINGWDRYDELESNDQYFAPFGFLNHKIKLGFDLCPQNCFYNRIGFFVGANIPQFLNNSSLADEMRIKVSPSFFAGINIGFNSEKSFYY